MSSMKLLLSLRLIVSTGAGPYRSERILSHTAALFPPSWTFVMAFLCLCPFTRVTHCCLIVDDSQVARRPRLNVKLSHITPSLIRYHSYPWYSSLLHMTILPYWPSVFERCQQPSHITRITRVFYSPRPIRILSTMSRCWLFLDIDCHGRKLSIGI